MKRLVLDIAPGTYAVLRLPADAGFPDGVLDAPGLVSVTRTADAVSVVCQEDQATRLLDAVRSEAGNAAVVATRGGWRLLSVLGPLEFTLTGIMAALSGSLAAAGVTLFALSTYDTDHVLVPAADLGRAVEALRAGGHEVRWPAESR